MATKRQFQRITKKQIEERPKKGIAVDGSSLGNPGESRCKIVNIDTMECLMLTDPFHGTNNLAEYLALTYGIYFAFKLGVDIVYSDSHTAQVWVANGSINTSLPRDNKSKDVYDRLYKARKFMSKCDVNKDIELATLFISHPSKFPDYQIQVVQWNTARWGENIADLGFKK